MPHPFPLTAANRIKLAQAFLHQPRVDLAIESTVEGQMGAVWVDDPANPTAFCIAHGPFRYYAGDAAGAGGRALLRDTLCGYDLLMPASEPWLEAAQAIYGERLQPFPRYRFSAAALDAAHLTALSAQCKPRGQIAPIDADLAAWLAAQGNQYESIADFGSAQNFAARGLGFAALDGEQVLGAAWSSLVCSRGIEVSIFVEERARGRRLATVLACRLLLACLEGGREPHWDAANPASYKLALKLGYTFIGMYEGWCVIDNT